MVLKLQEFLRGADVRAGLKQVVSNRMRPSTLRSPADQMDHGGCPNFCNLPSSRLDVVVCRDGAAALLEH